VNRKADFLNPQEEYSITFHGMCAAFGFTLNSSAADIDRPNNIICLTPGQHSFFGKFQWTVSGDLDKPYAIKFNEPVRAYRLVSVEGSVCEFTRVCNGDQLLLDPLHEHAPFPPYLYLHATIGQVLYG
jgi:hypothetical protein